MPAESTATTGARPPAGWPARAAGAARPWLFFTLVAAAVLLAGAGDYDPTGLPFAYALRATVAATVLIGALLWWWSRRRGWSWGTDLVPALLGGIGGLILAGSLAGTPYPPGGLAGDQAFRTAAITRFADSWHNADFTFAGLPSFYAPAYFWVLGRAADLAGIEPWRSAKPGTVLTAVLVPVITYLLWRRLVRAELAAVLAAAPLLVENYYEPYAWLVLFAIVPWWLAVVPGAGVADRRGRSPGQLVWLGLIGAVLFLTYYYFFFIAGLALLAQLLVICARREWDWRQVGRTGLVLAVAAAGSAVYWLPLAISMVRAEHTESLANRWLASSHPSLPLPMLELSVTGALSLAGLVHLVWTVNRDALSRGLLVLLAAAYGWYLIGAPAVLAGTPLLSFRGKPLIAVILLTAGVLAAARLVRLAAERFAGRDVRRLSWALGAVLVLYAGVGFADTVRDSPLTKAAHATALPDGTLPPHHPADAEVPDPPAQRLRDTLAGAGAAPGRAVLLSDRVDLFALYPYHGFLQWNAHYAHPAAGFGARVDFLERLAGAGDPAEFARLARDNEFGPIDGFVLRDHGDELVLRYSEDAFPAGLRTAELRFDRGLLTGTGFVTTPVGDYLVAVTR